MKHTKKIDEVHEDLIVPPFIPDDIIKGQDHNVQKTKGSPNLEYSSTFSYSLHSKHCMFHYLQESTEAVKLENRKGKKK